MSFGSRRTQTRLGGGDLGRLAELVPRGVHARKSTGEVVRARDTRTREQRGGMINLVFVDVLIDVVGVERNACVNERRDARIGNGVTIAGGHCKEVARGLDIRRAERIEQIDGLHRERDGRLELVGKLEVFLARDLVRETAHHSRDRVDGAAAHLRAQLVAQGLKAKRFIDERDSAK